MTVSKQCVNLTLAQPVASHSMTTGPPQRRPLLLLVEGESDAHFLRRITSVLYGERLLSDDLDALVRTGRAIMVVTGGGIAKSWASCFAPLQCPEFHLYDRECEPESSRRRHLVEQVNARPNCIGRLTSKRAMENYLHRSAIIAAGGPELSFGDDDDLAELLVHGRLDSLPHSASWNEVSHRTRQRLRYQAKRWLVRQAVSQMTAALLAERDPRGEVIDWLTTIIELANPVKR